MDAIKNNNEENKSITDRVVDFVKTYWLYLAIVFVGLSIYLIWCLPISMAEGVEKLENEIRATHATIIGGIGAFIIIIVQVYRANLLKKQVEQQQEQIKQQQEQNDEQRRANISSLTLDQYIKAVDQLGKHDSIGVRLGGIYSLEKIMNSDNKEDQKYHDGIIELLCAYLREKGHFDIEKYNNNPEGNKNILDKYKVKTDFQAILTILGRREYRKKEKISIDLRNTNLYKYSLAGANLENANLIEAHLENANLIEANLENANLIEAHLENAFLIGAHLENADLREAHLENVNLSEAHLEHANLSAALLEHADLSYAHLENANLFEANLENADLSWAHLINANLWGAHLENANLRGTNLENANLIYVNFKNIKLVPNFEKREETREEIIDFIKELEKAEKVEEIKLDDKIMKIIEEEYPDLLERIKLKLI